MVIEKVIVEKGKIPYPQYDYNGINKLSVTGYEDFYYKKKYIIDGETFLLGSTTKNSRNYRLIELITKAPAIQEGELPTFNDEDILNLLEKKLARNPCSTLSDVINYFQTNLSVYKIDLWKINSIML